MSAISATSPKFTFQGIEFFPTDDGTGVYTEFDGRITALAALRDVYKLGPACLFKGEFTLGQDGRLTIPNKHAVRMSTYDQSAKELAEAERDIVKSWLRREAAKNDGWEVTGP